MTIWPASVPVNVELCPAHSRAIPNRIGAAPPRNSGSSRCASSMLATSWPWRWKTEALRTRIAALTKNAAFSAMAESIRL
jgi:hypothetical protein